MELGDVSKNKPANSNNNSNNKNGGGTTGSTEIGADGEPTGDDLKPLIVNEETRWKSKSMKHRVSIIQHPEEHEVKTLSTEEIVGKALLILNKMSWTTLERLTEKFMLQTDITNNAEVRAAIIAMIVNKAQTQPHFGGMYAQLCAIIAKQFKPFKKELLTACQHEFEVNTEDKIKEATKDLTAPDEIEYHANLIRKAYIGHMKFLGELYMRDVVKLAIILHCLDELLKDEEHEESLECFASLMTTMGAKLDSHAKQNGKPFDWGKVEAVRNHTNISNRIKFLLQDLMDLKDRGWIERRQKDTAKTIDQIHKEAAREEQQARMNPRRASTTTAGLRRSTSLAAASTIDDDGFTQISRGSMKKVNSNLDVMGENGGSGAGGNAPPPPKPKPAALRRSQSQPAVFTVAAPSPVNKNNPPAVKETPTPDECGKKIKTIMKEYFISGDTADSVLSVHELVQAGQGQASEDGSKERGAKVVEGGVLLVMEMKEADVQKFLTVMGQCVQEQKLEKESIIMGLNDPLEFLSDIEIDAPLAGSHLALIVSECIKFGAFDMSFFKGAPEFFLSDGKPAEFAIKVLKKRGGDPSEEEMKIVEELMTEADKKAHESAAAMFKA
mmetsp:Transcript_7913/g.12511  ORF Transcript_7913/g.12511 Transcript_7913/m.12511 type:complete len:611 (+) Transcript_7913:281-2113(+)